MAESQLQEVGVDDAVYRFVDTVKQLPWVRIVALQGTAPTARIWTIISAPPFDSNVRRPIYEAQVVALAMTTRPEVEFRLVNVQEVEDTLVDILPEAYQPLYQRETVVQAILSDSKGEEHYGCRAGACAGVDVRGPAGDAR